MDDGNTDRPVTEWREPTWWELLLIVVFGWLFLGLVAMLAFSWWM